MIRAFIEFVRVHSWGYRSNQNFNDKDIFFTMNALVGELGEVANVLKKEQAAIEFPNYRNKVQERENDGCPTHKEMFIDEAGDTLFYYIQLLNKRGVTLDEVIEKQVEKINKLSTEHGKPYLK